MRWLDSKMDIPLQELPRTFITSLEDELLSRGCPMNRLAQAKEAAQRRGVELLSSCLRNRVLTHRLYAQMVQDSTSYAMKQLKLVS